MLKLASVCFVFVIVLLSSACESVSYYSQAAAGQFSIWWQSQPIEMVIADKSTDLQEKQRLQKVLLIRDFASEHLLLPDNNSYRYYSDLKRSHVVWNVFAAKEFSISPMQWCFPIAGCVSYRGYFSEQAASDYADNLAAQGYDTYVGGVAAYSTLGWFADPILNTFISRNEARLAGLIFHELAHQQVYLAGDTRFNESFATAVEIVGVKRWLASKERAASTVNQSDTQLLAQYLQQINIQKDFVALMLKMRQQLDDLYQQQISSEQKRQGKQKIISDLINQNYPAFKAKWGGINNYDRWVSNEQVAPDTAFSHHSLNNAKLSTIASYHQWLPAFQQLLIEVNNDLPSFYRRVQQLAELDTSERGFRLEALRFEADSAASPSH